MGWFDTEHKEVYDQYQNTPPEKHKAALSHELIAAAASYEAAKAYEKHCAENGKPQSHALAKELLAGFVGAFVDREVETKGLDFIDREKAKRHAHEHIQETYTEDIYARGN